MARAVGLALVSATGLAFVTEARAWPPKLQLGDLDGSNGFRVDGAAELDLSGDSVAGAGDINGDGIDDLVIGATGVDVNGAYSGSSYVVFGRADGFDAAIEVSALDGSNGFRLDGEGVSDQSGFSVAATGDINGDGIDDLVIGAPTASPYSSMFPGSSYVVYGRHGAFPASVELAALDGTSGFRVDGERSGDRSGYSVAGVGDINGDGLDDLAIGAPRADSNGESSGNCYVVFGRAHGFASTLNLGDLYGGNGFRIEGVRELDNSGYSVAAAGDINGDGIDDLILGAPYADSSEGASGSSYVVFGHAGDFAANLPLSDLNGSNGFRLDGEDADARSGVSVAGAGDVNGDGIDDLVIGLHLSDPNGQVAHAGYVVFGHTGEFAATLNLGALDGSNGFRLDGIAQRRQSRTSVFGAGDINADGIDDLVIGAYGADPNGDHGGAGYVVLGHTGDFDARVDLDTLDGNNGFRLDAAAIFAGVGFSVAGDHDINGDGIDDLVIGAPYARPNGDGSGTTYVVFGNGRIFHDGFDGGP